MAKHKCKRCKGKKVIVETYADERGRPHATEVTCPDCKGTGWIEK